MNTDQEKRCEQDDEVRLENIKILTTALEVRYMNSEMYSDNLARTIQACIERWAQRREA